jgi:hypothetical protein
VSGMDRPPCSTSPAQTATLHPQLPHPTCASAALLGGDSCQGCRCTQAPLQAVVRRAAAGAARGVAFCDGSGSKGRRCTGGGKPSAWRAGQQGGQRPRLR